MLLAAGLFLAYLIPGGLLSKLLLKRCDMAFSFLASILILTQALTALNILRLPCTLPVVSGILAAVSVVLLGCLFYMGRGICSRADIRRQITRARRTLRVVGSRPVLCLMAVATAALVACFIYKQVLNPIPGYDVSIRWEYLAVRIFEQGNSNFYPATTDAQFAVYGMPDAMGMMVASGYWWAYALAGRTGAELCIPVVVLQLLAIFCAGWGLARALGASIAGAMLAVFLLGVTGVVTTGVFIGQEVGYLTLAGLLLLTFAAKLASPKPEAIATCLAMGIAAGAAALTREYGIAYFLIGFLACLLSRSGLRAALALAGAFAVLAGPWLLHVWSLTGNPFYTLGILGLFPQGPHLWAQLVSHVKRLSAANIPVWFTTNQPWICLIHSLPGLLGLAVFLRFRPAASRGVKPVVFVFGLMMLALCVWGYFPSLGDLYYSFRVAVPGIAVFAITLGVWLAASRAFTARAAKPWVFAVIALLAFHAGLTLLARYDYLWHSPSQWPAMTTTPGLRGDRVYGYPMAAHAFVKDDMKTFEGRVILSSDLYLQRALMDLPVRVLPAWSPGMGPAMDPNLTPSAARRLLQEQGVGFVIVNKSAPFEGTWELNSPWFNGDEENLSPRAPLGEGVEIRMLPP